MVMMTATTATTTTTTTTEFMVLAQLPVVACSSHRDREAYARVEMMVSVAADIMSLTHAGHSNTAKHPTAMTLSLIAGDSCLLHLYRRVRRPQGPPPPPPLQPLLRMIDVTSTARCFPLDAPSKLSIRILKQSR